MSIKVPPIKSQGIKSKLVPHIRNLLELSNFKIDRWVEPFLGTCVIPLNIQAKSYYLSDKNPHLIDFYKGINNGEITPLATKKFLQENGAKLAVGGEDYYYLIRDRFNTGHDSLDFLFLNRACFNGMMRFNKNGGFNVPFCRKLNRFNSAYITKICNQIKVLREFFKYNEVVIRCCDFSETITEASDSDIIYCDPPYIDRYNDYYNGWTEENELLLFQLLNSKPTKFILSTWHHNCFRENKYINGIWSAFSISTVNHLSPGRK